MLSYFNFHNVPRINLNQNRNYFLDITSYSSIESIHIFFNKRNFSFNIQTIHCSLTDRFIRNSLCDNFPAGMRCFWEISMRSLSRQTSERPLINISRGTTFLRRLSQIHLKKYIFFVTPIRRLINISKKPSSLWRL